MLSMAGEPAGQRLERWSLSRPRYPLDSEAAAWAVGSVVRAPASHAGGQRFKSSTAHYCSQILIYPHLFYSVVNRSTDPSIGDQPQNLNPSQDGANCYPRGWTGIKKNSALMLAMTGYLEMMMSRGAHY